MSIIPHLILPSRVLNAAPSIHLHAQNETRQGTKTSLYRLHPSPKRKPAILSPEGTPSTLPRQHRSQRQILPRRTKALHVDKVNWKDWYPWQWYPLYGNLLGMLLANWILAICLYTLYAVYCILCTHILICIMAVAAQKQIRSSMVFSTSSSVSMILCHSRPFFKHPCWRMSNIPRIINGA